MMDTKIKEARNILSMVADKRSIWGLFSGGKDSLAMAHIASHHPNFEGVIHVRTKTGVLSDIASDYAIAMARGFGWTVIEKSPFTTYAMLVAEYGFPGPQQHDTMYQMLKERALDMAKKDARKIGKHERLVFTTGIRRAESQRRATFPEVQNQKGVYWVCPLINWSNDDVTEYLAMHGLVVQDEQSRECHMVGAGRKAGEWKWSKWTVMPASELNEFLSWCLERGMTVLDERLLANLKRRGMGAATPIVIAHDIPIQMAVQQAVAFHKLLVKVANE